MPGVCTDDVLAQVATCCPNLQVVAIGGSAGVSDKGVKFMTSVGGVPPKPISASTVDLRDPRTRVGFQATPIIAGFTDQLEMYKASLLRNIFWLSLQIPTLVSDCQSSQEKQYGGRS